ncbi:DUF1661 domain-containing protein [Porphyromonas gulae]|uniref:DUF1661 domain-containing protein n=1 Tax=Porphyromonas gulae TaxID=111105 RepID=UPI003741F83F
MPKPPFSGDCATKPTRERNGDEGCREQILSSQRRKSRKNAHFCSQINIFASDNSERSLAIQNSVPQSTPLISKSLPIYPLLNGNTLLLNKIVHRQKVDVRTKKFPRHVFRKLRPQSEHFRARNFSAYKIRRPFTSSA